MIIAVNLSTEYVDNAVYPIIVDPDSYYAESIVLTTTADFDAGTKDFIETNTDWDGIPEDEFPHASKMFEEPIMTREYFENLTDNFRSPHLWKFVNGKWEVRHPLED